jgi:DNA polymerase-1
MMGRRRLFYFASPDLHLMARMAQPSLADLEAAKVSAKDQQLLRAAANAPIQGSSADLLKAAMVQLARVLDPSAARLLLTVHDEVVLEVEEGAAGEVEEVVREVME